MIPNPIEKKQEKENIWNVPNLLTLFRVIITVVIIYLVLAGFHIFSIIGAFLVGMFTDAIDGRVARRFNLTTEFGRKFDMIADRTIMMGTILTVLIKLSIAGILAKQHFIQLIMMLLREIVTIPFGLAAMISGKGIPQVRIIGKATTVMQTVTFPLILLSTAYETFGFSFYLAVATGVVGLTSAFFYINDMKDLS